MAVSGDGVLASHSSSRLRRALEVDGNRDAIACLRLRTIGHILRRIEKQPSSVRCSGRSQSYQHAESGGNYFLIPSQDALN